MEGPSNDLVALGHSSTQTGSSSVEGAESEEGGGISAAFHSTSQQAQKWFGFVKEGAGSFLKNIKESSSKVIQSMSDAVHTAKQSLDISYITSRIIVMSYPHDDPFHQNSITSVRTFLDEKHPSGYLVFNLSTHTYDASKLDNHVYEFAWPHRSMPNLEKLVDVCRSMDAWLRADKANVIVVHCSDGRSISSVMVSAYLLFLRAVSNPAMAMKLFWAKRDPHSPTLLGSPSQMRYLQHLHRLVQSTPYKPHGHRLTLNMLRLSTVPLFNAIRTGCKPFVDVYQDGERVYASATHETMEAIRSFHAEDGSVEIPLAADVRGNLLVVVHHVRAIPVAKKAGIGMTAVRMFQFQMHTGFLDPGTTTIELERQDLDGSSVKKQDKFTSPFRVVVEVEWNRATTEQATYNAASWQNLPYPKAHPLTCFSSNVEEEETTKMLLDTAHTVPASRSPDPRVTTPSSPPPTIVQPPSNADLEEVISNPSLFNEEGTSAGAGTLLNLEGAPVSQDAAKKSPAHDFFSQLNWAEQTSGSAEYAPFRENSSTDSDSSSSDSDSDEEELRHHHHDPFLSASNGSVPGHSVPFVNFDDFETGSSPVRQGHTHNSKGSTKKSPSPQRKSGEEGKLIEFSIAEEEDEPSTNGQQSTPTRGREKGRTANMFGASFDPWGTPSTAARQPNHGSGNKLEISDLLGLNDSGDHSDSSDLQSEVQTAGAETFSGHSDLEGVNPVSSSNQFDPFGALSSQQSPSAAAVPLQPQQAPATSSLLSSDPLLNLLMNTPTTAATTSTSRPASANQTSASTSVSSDPFASLLGPTVTSSTNGAITAGRQGHQSLTPPTLVSNLGVGSSSAGHRRVSQPPHINNHLSPLHGVSAGAGLGFTTSYSQPNLTAFGSSGFVTPPKQHQQQQQPSQPNKLGQGYGTGRAHPSYLGGGSANTSPRSMSPTPLGGHSGSTGNLLQGGSGGQTTQARDTPQSQSSTSANTLDPFAQFNLGLMSGPKPSATSVPPPHKSPSQPAFRAQQGNAAPYQPYYMRQPAGESSGSTQGGSRKAPTQVNSQPRAKAGTGLGTGTGLGSGTGSVFTSRKPNYNPVIGPESKTGIGPKPRQSDFSDLLGGNFSSSANSGPRTLKDMRAESDINNALDPDRAKVAAWAERKERNIRALLSSLSEILWEGESRWKGVGMHQLVEPDQVKKHYRKACLSVHPDKIKDPDHESLARAIFDELNDAYAMFEESGARPLY